MSENTLVWILAIAVTVSLLAIAIGVGILFGLANGLITGAVLMICWCLFIVNVAAAVYKNQNATAPQTEVDNEDEA